ncbi:hypothetical protein ACO1O0_009380 [Amphichorda felina]
MDTPPQTIALIGLGTIGLSFAALHLHHSPTTNIRLYDVRPDLQRHIDTFLPVSLRSCCEPGQEPASVQHLLATGRIAICSSVEDVCRGATIVQEQGPDTLAFKQGTWAGVVQHADPGAHLWSSTSGICASEQVEHLDPAGKARVLVVHPFNPPTLIPLIEVAPSPHTDPSRTQFAVDYFARLGSGHRPVVIKKETPGFVGNRLAFALFREACHLVADGVVSVQDLDTIMESSLGPRWAAAGPFKTYNLGGGEGGIGAFMHHLAGTIQTCWDDAGLISLKGTSAFGEASAESSNEEDWVAKVARETREVYGRPTAEALSERDHDLTEILKAQAKRN